jgi:hypothetical protein
VQRTQATDFDPITLCQRRAYLIEKSIDNRGGLMLGYVLGFLQLGDEFGFVHGSFPQGVMKSIGRQLKWVLERSGWFGLTGCYEKIKSIEVPIRKGEGNNRITQRTCQNAEVK